MPIDTLHLRFGRGGGRTNVSDRNNRVDLLNVYQRLEAAGYDCTPVQTLPNGRRQKFTILLGDETVFELFSSTEGDYSYIYQIYCRPIFFSSFRAFWQVFETMDGDHRDDEGHRYNRLINHCVITRMDYTCDYPLPIGDIVTGLYVDRCHVVSVFDDVDAPYISHSWRQGHFNSFHYGREPSILKVYNKTEQRRLRSEEDTWGTAREPQRAERANQPPCTRFELKTTEAGKIAKKIWNSRADRTPRAQGNTATLAQLPNHLQDLAALRSCPFKGVLICKTKTSFRGSSATVEAHNARHEVCMGLLTKVYQRVGARRFWAEHTSMFMLYPWKPEFQPTGYYRAIVRRWLGIGGSVRRPPRARSLPDALTNGWPLEITGVLRPTRPRSIRQRARPARTR